MDMHSVVLLLAVPLLIGWFGLDLGLPPQPDLDLPIVPEHYDPKNPAPGPVPPSPEEDDRFDPRDEPAPIFYGEEIETPSDSLIYVIDFSCSMHNEERDLKAKAEFARSVSGLPPTLRFNVVVYSCQLSLWSPGMRLASDANKLAAIEFVESKDPSNGTATGPAVALALRLDTSNKSIVLLTDGEPNCGAEGMPGHRAMISNENTQDATISVFGIAAGEPWRSFCLEVAMDSGGSYVDVP
jgi:hypothetical protein